MLGTFFPQGLVEDLLNGGWIMLVLLCTAGGMWFSIGYRLRLLTRARVRDFQADLCRQPHSAGQRALFQRSVFGLKRGKALINASIATAPLLGLLGTVIGMMDTFAAIAAPAGEVASIGTAGAVGGAGASDLAAGISKALLTTQLGLIVAAPGLILGRILDRKEWQLTAELERCMLMANRLDHGRKTQSKDDSHQKHRQ